LSIKHLVLSIIDQSWLDCWISFDQVTQLLSGSSIGSAGLCDI
jgi:hypothetical protein